LGILFLNKKDIENEISVPFLWGLKVNAKKVVMMKKENI